MKVDLDALLELFSKYISTVGLAEGVDFLCESEWTEDEWDTLQAIRQRAYAISAERNAADRASYIK